MHDQMPLEVTLRGYGTPVPIDAQQLCHANLKAVNTRPQPNRVAPTAVDRVCATLAPASWNVIRVGRPQ